MYVDVKINPEAEKALKEAMQKIKEAEQILFHVKLLMAEEKPAAEQQAI